jgi:hypothetical protein
MANKSKEPVLDWYGNPIEGNHDGPRSLNSGFFMGETDNDGKRYLRIYSSGGVPGDRIAVDDMYLRLEDEHGKVIYDSRLPPPPDAKLLPGYIGYAREKQLKRYFPR